jgi:hypothetical protein
MGDGSGRGEGVGEGNFPNPVAEFHRRPTGEIKSTPLLRHRVVVPARKATWDGGPVRQPFPGVNFILQSWIYEFGHCSSVFSYYYLPVSCLKTTFGLGSSLNFSLLLAVGPPRNSHRARVVT